MSINQKGNSALKVVMAVGLLVIIGFALPAMALPPEMEADRLLISAAAETDKGKHTIAAKKFEKILSLKTGLRPEFYYEYGRHFYAVGNLKKAQENIEKYLKKAGSKGQYYRQSLQTLTAIEEQQIAMQRAIENRRKYLARFVDHGDGTVTDTKTGLMWASKDNGRSINWQNARSYCQRYSGGGHTDWRLPTFDELASLYHPEDENRHGYHVTKLIDISGRNSWSSETRGIQAVCCSFGSGKGVLGFRSHSNTYRALPVRSGK